MKRRSAWLTAAACALTASMPARAAQQPVEAPADLSKVQIVTYSSGLTGFFEPGTGKLYIYDSSLKNCVAIRQLTSLGKPLGSLKDFPGETTGN